MKTLMKTGELFFLSVIVAACCCTKTDLNERYQPLGMAVLTANNLLMVQYPQGPPENYQGENYKNLLKENYRPMYERLQPYRVVIQKMADRFKVSVFDGNTLVLTDWSCTEGRIDCWSYEKQCMPDTLNVRCDQ
jgi:hypothetical protein